MNVIVKGLRKQALSSRLIGSLSVFIGLGVLSYILAIFWSGHGQFILSIQKIGLPTFFGGALLASFSYLFRFIRWNISLKFFGYLIPCDRNVVIYLSGLSLTASPGKLGETLRSIFLLPFGVKVSDSVGAFVADRLSEVIGVALLGMVAGIFADSFSWILALILLCVLLGSWAISYAIKHPSSGKFWHWLAEKIKWLPIQLGESALVAWARLWGRLRSMEFAGFAFIAYGLQALVFAWFCHALQIDIQPADAVQIFVLATLLGAASMVPAGLGAMEAALVFQLMQVGATEPTAVAIAIATRLVTLWLGMSIGMVALFEVRRRSAIPTYR